MIVIADTTPLNYLILIDQSDLLPRLFGRVLIPPAVLSELQDPDTPLAVRTWVSASPPWLQVQPLQSDPDPELDYLDPGEREATALAQELKAVQLLLDETEGPRAAELRGLPFIGTLGVLRRASQLGWIDLPSTLQRLQGTTFHVSTKLIQSLLAEDADRKRRTE
jgi:predicted nucleic acid-binding protein